MSTRQGSHVNPAGVHQVTPGVFAVLAEAATDRKHVSGWTHNFYRYPARFSPRFAAAAIECLSRPGDLIADPYMGGGTTVVEGIAAGRHVVGNDLNSLATFITKVKTTPLAASELAEIENWAAKEVPNFTYHVPADGLSAYIDAAKTRNLSLVRARFIKKAVAVALASIANLPTDTAQDFAKCIVLRVSQWALDGRATHTPLREFRRKLAVMTAEMLQSAGSFADRMEQSGGSATLLNADASEIHNASPFRDTGSRIGLVVTSPPYPGVHVLYHRWQVDGRRETPAPYWIAGCNDGEGASYYNFGDRRQAAADNYFRTSLATLCSIRAVMREGGHMVQMVAFNTPEEQLPRYLGNMRDAGFAEVLVGGNDRIWRQVPNRKWHATFIGKTHSASEVVLIHRAV
jgi:hypothetical protein